MTTPDEGDSDDDWEAHRRALAQREEESSHLLVAGHRETEDEDDDGEFIYPGESPTTALEAGTTPASTSIPEQESTSDNIVSTERVTATETPEPSSSEAIPHSPIIVETPPSPQPRLSPLVSEVAPGTSQQHLQPAVPQPLPPTLPSPAQLESLYAAASSGDLPLLKRLFRNALKSNDVQQFSLANDASTRTGFTALHAAASRGYLDIVQWRE